MDINLKSMFYKPIDRDIKGVIKVGQADDENIKQELEEYVVTEQLNSHIEKFFESYKRSIVGDTDKNGVWISGFFGSGKSHFLKIISYLLDNKSIEGKKAINYFDDKGLDNFTLANMKQAGDASADIILFNIDSKSDSKNKSSKDAIVNVFNKVFNEMQGFCGNIPWLAQLEAQLVKDGVYDDFKNKFKEVRGAEWTKFRSNFYFEEDSIIQALSETTRMSKDSARKWFDKAESNYSLSIDDFATRVKEYCDSKGKDHHVIFLVDEIGQYIGDSRNLMLNLQTVVEDLGTACGGKCFVIVTSQEGLDEFATVKGKDFSKIQGRFDTRLSLSSANVDEVIKMRILRKTEGATEYLEALYNQKESVLKNILDFSANDAKMDVYKNSKEFAQVYPFVPYQFHLLQQAFNGVREHGASGKSLSKGERSLLGAFQQVAMEYMNSDASILVPFSKFYKTIENFLDSSITAVVMKAQKNDRLDEFDIEVLKLLFLVKYVKEIKSNISTLATLLIDKIDASQKELKDKVNTSLKKLIRETLVQQNGEEYTFLTNDEQDVNKEIKNMPVDLGEVVQKIGEIIFEDIYAEPKYKYSSKYMFGFNKIVDDRTRGPQSNEIGVKIITANFGIVGDITESGLKHLSTREHNVLVNISNDINFIEEIENVLRIDSYLRLKGGSKASISIEDIRTKKSREREERLKRAKFLIEEAIRTAEIFVSGSILDIKEKNGVDRINEGLKVLIESKYHKLNYIKEFIDAKELSKVLDVKINEITFMDMTPNRLAMDDIKQHIEDSTVRNLHITVKSILTKFSNAPYGWKEPDIQALLITLFKKQDIKMVLNSEVLSPNSREVLTYVTKRDYLERVVVKTREKVSPKYIKNLKELNKDLFSFSLPSDEDGMMRLFKDSCKNELYQIDLMLNNYDTLSMYPGKKVLVEGRKAFGEIIEIKDTLEFFKTASTLEDDFMDYVERVDAIKGFFFKKENGNIDKTSKGEQRTIFDKGLSVIKNYNDNKEYIVNDDVDKIINEIKAIINMKEPYKNIPKISLYVEAYKNKILTILEEESIPVIGFINTCKKEVLDNLSKYDFKDNFVGRITEEFGNLIKRTEEANNFVVLSSMSDRAEKLKIRWINTIIAEYETIKRREIAEIARANKVEDTSGEAKYVPGISDEVKVIITTKTLSMRELVKGEKVIKNKEDILDVIESLKAKLEQELEKDTIISLI